MTMGTITALESNPLFKNFSEEDLRQFLKDSFSYTKSFSKGEEIYPFNTAIQSGGIVLSGEVNIQTEAGENKGGIVDRSYPGDLIGHAFNISGQTNDVAHFIAGCDDTSVLFSDLRGIMCRACHVKAYTGFLENLVSYLASTNIALNKKMELLTQKTLRDKLLVCFNQMADRYHSRSFTIPYNREQLAQYICAERSSVCRELGRMQDEHLIQLSGNHIVLLYRHA